MSRFRRSDEVKIQNQLVFSCQRLNRLWSLLKIDSLKGSLFIMIKLRIYSNILFEFNLYQIITLCSVKIIVVFIDAV